MLLLTIIFLRSACIQLKWLQFNLDTNIKNEKTGLSVSQEKTPVIQKIHLQVIDVLTVLRGEYDR